MSDVVFVLGAGFSRAISDEMPLMIELSQVVRARLEGCGRPLAAATDVFGDDIERWLSFLAEPQPWSDDAAALRNRAAFADVSREIDLVLTERQVAAVRLPQPAWLAALIDYWGQTASTVLTFNYDVLVEAAALEHLDPKIHAWSSLYRVPVTPAANRIAAVRGYSAMAPFGLLKLHGSVTWYWSGPSAEASDPIYDVGLRGGWSPDGVTSLYEDHLPSLVADKVPMVVPPTATKSGFYKNALLKSQWHQAAAALETARELVIIGYSLPQSDLIVRALLATTLNPDANVNPVDRDPTVSDRLRDLLGDRIGTGYLVDDPVAAFVKDRCT